MTTLRALLDSYNDEAIRKWVRYYPNKNTYQRSFEIWPRGKAIERLVNIENKAAVIKHVQWLKGEAQ